MNSTFRSGAQSSGNALRYDLIPRSFLRRVALRFGMGAEKYPPFNYRSGLADKEYILDRINHLQEHFQGYIAPENEDDLTDDNLGAIAWGCAFLCEVEAHPEGKKIVDEIRRERGRLFSPAPATQP